MLPVAPPQQRYGIRLLRALRFFWRLTLSAPSCHVPDRDVALNIRSLDLYACRIAALGQDPLCSQRSPPDVFQVYTHSLWHIRSVGLNGIEQGFCLAE